MATAEVNGINIYYEVAGQGPSLVVINGLGSDVSEVASVTGPLAKQCTVLVFDNRGAGRSDKPDEPYTLEGMVEDTAGVMRAAGMTRASVLGISMGGRIALARDRFLFRQRAEFLNVIRDFVSSPGSAR